MNEQEMELTKEQAIEFLTAFGWDYGKSICIKDFCFPKEINEEHGLIYSSMDKETFLKDHLMEVNCFWLINSYGETFYEEEDWQECLGNHLFWSEESEKEFIEFCKKNNIDYSEWVEPHE